MDKKQKENPEDKCQLIKAKHYLPSVDNEIKIILTWNITQLCFITIVLVDSIFKNALLY